VRPSLRRDRQARALNRPGFPGGSNRTDDLGRSSFRRSRSAMSNRIFGRSRFPFTSTAKAAFTCRASATLRRVAAMRTPFSPGFGSSIVFVARAGRLAHGVLVSFSLVRPRNGNGNHAVGQSVVRSHLHARLRYGHRHAPRKESRLLWTAPRGDAVSCGGDRARRAGRLLSAHDARRAAGLRIQ
jgi:hypothetical protein